MPALLRYLLSNFEISEITPSPPWFKLVKKNIASPEILRHNLPQPEYGHFIGRETELAQVNRILLPYPHSQYAIVTIDGGGGVGKSALALEIAHQILRGTRRSPKKERFAAIIWVSAKSTVLTANGIIHRKQALRSLKDIFAAIAVTLEQVDITHLPIKEQTEAVRKILTRQRTLLVIDNLETVDDEAVMNFILELPAPTKAIVTTRHRIDVAYPIRLTGMVWQDAQILIAEECQKKLVRLTEVEKRHLYDQTGGVPLAIVWSVAQLGFGYSIESLLNRIKNASSDIALFCFETVIEKIRAKPSYRAVMALSLYPDGTTRERLGYLAGLSDSERDDSLVELEKLSLINRDGANFTMLPLTREYVLAKLDNEKDIKKHLEFRLTSVPFAEIIPHPSKWWRSVSISELRITVGWQVDGEQVEFVVGTRTGNAHSLIFGTTGSGKSNFINGLVLNLALNYSHNELKIWLLDFKGAEVGYEFLRKIPHVEKVNIGFESLGSRNLFNELRAELNRRISLFHDSKCRDFDDFRRSSDVSLPRLVVIIDEMQIVKQDKMANEQLIGLVRTGRSLGVHFIFATQSVNDSAIDNQILQNISSKFVLRSREDDAKILLGKDELLAKNLRVGEIVFQTLHQNVARFQSAYLSTEEMDYYIQQIAQLDKTHLRKAVG